MTLTAEPSAAVQPLGVEEPTIANLSRTLRWRDQVLRFLRDEGVMAVAPLRTEYGPFRDRGEIELPGWTLLARRQQRIDVAGSVDHARSRADRDGSRYSAAVIFRRSHGVAGAYVVMPLSEFISLLKRTPEG